MLVVFDELLDEGVTASPVVVPVLVAEVDVVETALVLVIEKVEGT